MSVVKGRGARDPLSEITKIGVLKFDDSNTTTIKHVYNIFAHSVEISAVHFDINGPPNLAEIVPVVGIRFMVPLPSLCNILAAGYM